MHINTLISQYHVIKQGNPHYRLGQHICNTMKFEDSITDLFYIILRLLD